MNEPDGDFSGPETTFESGEWYVFELRDGEATRFFVEQVIAIDGSILTLRDVDGAEQIVDLSSGIVVAAARRPGWDAPARGRSLRDRVMRFLKRS